jgi:predicted AAA+ superfamily ATPase
MTFVQSLTEAVRRSSDSILLVSIPESDIEIGGEGGRATLEILANTIGRIESVWKPVTATESFEIVRRRLFSPEMDYPARDAALAAFRELYAGNSGDFPSGVAEGDTSSGCTPRIPSTRKCSTGFRRLP